MPRAQLSPIRTLIYSSCYRLLPFPHAEKSASVSTVKSALVNTDGQGVPVSVSVKKDLPRSFPELLSMASRSRTDIRERH